MRRIHAGKRVKSESAASASAIAASPCTQRFTRRASGQSPSIAMVSNPHSPIRRAVICARIR
ncbi:hypothetical protein AQ883_12310 [Burkholderia pseudomallei]|nr:hypothetical protein SZ30_25840 [Burkholderia pseudomallei]OMZ46654.1 hypothetical protein AQ864_09420 [Burkholderia pseudomallei]OMZ50915.1 hypothetical protein AQ863_27450 [Burkholderia pseudomallei]OMZ60275.1 hypothetical protein AQ867_21925 [Burkholderia pseudomallei]OMZ73975.1 hypothetical protein AQ866_01005 [Burkholderia pseudomallei]